MTQEMNAVAPSSEADRLAFALAAIAAEAGSLLACIVDRAAGHAVKGDGSPTTSADLESERLILARLAATCPGIPVVTEEDVIHHAGGRFILVDPLDGTKDYLTGAGEYSVNIAFVDGNRPVAAALCSPPLGRVWAAGTGAFCAHLDHAGHPGPWQPVRVRRVEDCDLVALSSRRHGDVEGETCLDQLAVALRRTASSAAKFGLIASGEADVYVRCGPTMEWDTAAGDHIVTQAGGHVVGPDGLALTYGHTERGYLNGPFAALSDARLAARLSLPGAAVSPRRGCP